jgi:hypothetical protein
MGTAYFVCNRTNANGSDGNSGLSPSQPLATLAKALTLVTASADDVIFVMPGHAENISGAGTVTCSTAGCLDHRPRQRAQPSDVHVDGDRRHVARLGGQRVDRELRVHRRRHRRRGDDVRHHGERLHVHRSANSRSARRRSCRSGHHDHGHDQPVQVLPEPCMALRWRTARTSSRSPAAAMGMSSWGTTSRGTSRRRSARSTTSRRSARTSWSTEHADQRDGERHEGGGVPDGHHGRDHRQPVRHRERRGAVHGGCGALGGELVGGGGGDERHLGLTHASRARRLPAASLFKDLRWRQELDSTASASNSSATRTRGSTSPRPTRRRAPASSRASSRRWRTPRPTSSSRTTTRSERDQVLSRQARARLHGGRHDVQRLAQVRAQAGRVADDRALHVGRLDVAPA